MELERIRKALEERQAGLIKERQRLYNRDILPYDAALGELDNVLTLFDEVGEEEEAPHLLRKVQARRVG